MSNLLELSLESQTATKIYLAKDSAEKELVYALRYQVYVNELGINPLYANHKNQILKEPLDENGYLIIAKLNEQIIGSLRVNFTRQSDLGYLEDLYQIKLCPHYPKNTSITTKFVVAKPFRNSLVTAKLAKKAYELGRSNGIKTDIIHSVPSLVPFYKRLGYKPHIKEYVYHPEMGKVLVQKLELNDIHYLTHLKSPFVKTYLRTI